MKYICITIALLSGLFAQSQNDTRGGAELGEAKSLLWKISGNGLTEPSYLFGTIHITCDATLDKATLDALDKTEQLYLEMDMDDPSLQASMMTGMMMKGGKKISDMLSAEDFKLLDKYLQENAGISANMVNTLNPMLISMMFLPSMLDCPMQSVEEELVKVSKLQKEAIFGLETAKEQMDALDAIPYQGQVDELITSIKDNLKSDKAEMAKMYETYKSKDINAMLELSMDPKGTIANNQDALLNDRNKKWIPKIEKTVKEKPTFFGVGAGHLAGESGVIALLRKAGFKVVAVY